MKAFVWAASAAVVLLVVASSALGATSSGAKKGSAAAVERGRYLVAVGVCSDCHTPLKMGPNGPEPDMTRFLSGHPESLALPEAPKMAEPWGISGAMTLTAWSGPWGTSFTANLTPDPETGLGKWTVQNFIETIRTGRHEGRGRPILPPMPWRYYANMTDEDLKAIFAYLRTVPPVRNRVPDPIVAEAAAQEAGASPLELPRGDGAAPGGAAGKKPKPARE